MGAIGELLRKVLGDRRGQVVLHPVIQYRAMVHRLHANIYAVARVPRSDPCLETNRSIAVSEYLSTRLALLEKSLENEIERKR